MARIGIDRAYVQPALVTTSPSASLFVPTPDSQFMCGIDSLKLTFKINSESDAFLDRAARSGSNFIPLDSGARLSTTRNRRRETWACLTFNPARVVDPFGWRPCPYEQLQRAIDQVWAEAAGYCLTKSAWEPDYLRIKEIHITRDFTDVRDPVMYVQHFGSIRGGKAVVRGGTTAEFGSRSAEQTTLYDKSLQSKQAPPGTLRFEARLTNNKSTDSLLAKYELCSVGDLCGDLVDRLGFDRWQRWNLGDDVLNIADFQERLLSTVPDKLRSELLGYLIQESRRPGSAGRSSATRAKRTSQFEEYGLSQPDVGFAGRSSQLSGRLDWNTATEAAI